MTDDPTLAELLAIWPRLTDDARQSLLRIARAKAAPGAGGWLDRQASEMKGDSCGRSSAFAATAYQEAGRLAVRPARELPPSCSDAFALTPVL